MVEDGESEWKCSEMDGEAADAGADVDEVEQGSKSNQAVEKKACCADAEKSESQSGKEEAEFPNPISCSWILMPESKQAMQ